MLPLPREFCGTALILETAGRVSYWHDDVVEVAKMWKGLSGLTDLPGRKAFQQWKLQRREMMRRNYSVSHSETIQVHVFTDLTSEH